MAGRNTIEFNLCLLEAVDQYDTGMETTPKTVRVKDIAKALGISIGTVDRALHARSGIGAKTKSRILQKANELGYKPNLAAQALKVNRQVHIAVVLPTQIACFFDPLRAGIRAAAAATVGPRIQLDFYEHPRLGHGDREILETMLGMKYDGLIVTPGYPKTVESLIRQLARRGTAVLCVASDAPNSERVASVTVDAYTSGALAAELLAYKLQGKAFVATITGELETVDHAEKLRGFAANLAILAPHLTLLPAIESHEKCGEAYRQTITLFKGTPRPSGLYISTANSIPVLQALEKQGLLGRVQIITTDLFRELAQLIESGEVLATLYQRPFMQGEVAFKTLLAHLLGTEKPLSIQRLAPHIVLRSNLPLFIRRLADYRRESESTTAQGTSEQAWVRPNLR